MMKILVLNTGSSSIKYHLYDMRDESEQASGQIVGIGDTVGEAHQQWRDDRGVIHDSRHEQQFADHRRALDYLFSHLQENGVRPGDVAAIGHRVVHGGEVFLGPTPVDDRVIGQIRELIPLAPLHNPVNLLGIELIRQHWPGLPQYAVFDTAFHQHLPETAYHYALPENLATAHPVRRYGFHGISYAYVSQQAADYLGQPLEQLKLIALHLGNGASMAAIRHGHSVDTSMGMTPLEGLVMGTRCGDIDASVIFYLEKQLGYRSEEIEDLLNHRSGLVGLCQHNDMRRIHRDAAAGDRASQTAIDIFCYRIRKYIGAYFAALEGVDALVFSGGIGENDPEVRQRVLAPLGCLGISLDEVANRKLPPGTGGAIHRPGTTPAVLVIPTNEELEIARQVRQCLTVTG